MADNPFDTSGGSTPTQQPQSNPFETQQTSVGNYSSATQDLINLAHARGGAVSQAVDELTHPQTSILSTIGDGLKNAFKGFVDIISVPSEVVAGIMDPSHTVGEAIQQHIRPSDVVFGKEKPNQTLMQKVGGFLTRTATDVLLDPLTYVTFGAGDLAVLGGRAAVKLTVDGGIETLTKEGLQNLNYLKAVQRQSQGLTGALAGAEGAATLTERLANFKSIRALEDSGKIAPEVVAQGKDDLKELLRTTIDSPLNPDFAKKALASTLEANPALGQTLIDKGGIKFFGQSILSGQRISAVSHLIPGMTWLDEATQQSRLAIGSLFDPTIQGFRQANGASQFVRLPPEYLEFQSKVADLADYLKEERVKNMVSIMKANKIDPNISGQFFMSSVENGIVPIDENLARAYKQLLGYNETELNYLRKSGIPISKLDNHAPHVLVNSGIKLMPIKMPPSSKAGAALQRTMEGPIFNQTPEQLREFEQAVLEGNKKVIEDTIANTKQTGFEIFDDNFFTASIARSMDNVRSGTMKSLIDSLAGNFARKADEAPAGWVGLDLTKFKNANELLVKQGMAENQLVFHPAIAKKIQEFTGALYGDEGTRSFLQSYDRLQNVWKASVTSIFPAFHGRNAISNVLLNYNDIGLEAINPQTHALTAQIMHADMQLNGLLKDTFVGGQKSEEALAKIDDIMSRKAFTDTSGYTWTFGELRSVIKRNNIALRDDIVGQIDSARTPEEMVNALMPNSFGNRINPLNKASVTNPLNVNFAPYQVGRKFGNIVEGNARLVNFLTNLRKTGDVGLAAERTKQFLFDYQNLSNFEKTVLKRLVPFYTFTRKNIEAQVKTLLSAPGRTAAQLTALNNLGDAISGQTLTPEEEAALPDWVKGGISILAGKNGNKVEVLQSLGTPIEQPFQALTPNVLLSSVSPFVRLPVELGAGYDFFQGKPLSDVTNASALKRAPQAIKDFVGYTDVSFKDKNGNDVNFAVALRPDRLHLILNLPLVSRVLSSLKQIDAADVSDQNKWLQQLVGVRPFEFDTELEASKREQELKEKIQALLSSAGAGYELKRFIPKQ